MAGVNGVITLLMVHVDRFLRIQVPPAMALLSVASVVRCKYGKDPRLRGKAFLPAVAKPAATGCIASIVREVYC